jgi:hypothetical protein
MRLATPLWHRRLSMGVNTGAQVSCLIQLHGNCSLLTLSSSGAALAGQCPQHFRSNQHACFGAQHMHGRVPATCVVPCNWCPLLPCV